MVIGSIYYHFQISNIHKRYVIMLFIVFSFILRCIKKYLGIMCVDILVISMCLTFSFPLRCLGGGSE
nr:MAG TPA: Hexokinase [Caudoviricetes sp.]